MEWTKNVAQPIRQVAPRWSLRGLKEDFGELTADVVLLSGEVHLGRKPVIWLNLSWLPVIHSVLKGALRFTSSSEREKFSRLVLHQLHPVDKVLDLANRLDERMSELNGGRMWMAAHMRRTDCMCPILLYLFIITCHCVLKLPDMDGRWKQPSKIILNEYANVS